MTKKIYPSCKFYKTKVVKQQEFLPRVLRYWLRIHAFTISSWVQVAVIRKCPYMRCGVTQWGRKRLAWKHHPLALRLSSKWLLELA